MLKKLMGSDTLADALWKVFFLNIAVNTVVEKMQSVNILAVTFAYSFNFSCKQVRVVYFIFAFN